jgi:dihydroorotase/N-acyl-D-amino-acid deacylase
MARAAAAVLASCAALAVAQEPAAYDVLIRGGRVVDGSGNPWVQADVAVQGDAIVAVGARLPGRALRVIEARGEVVAPGFIDLHTHARRGIFQVPTAENYVRQGVTTLFEGPDGSSPLPLRPFLAQVAAAHLVPNFASFVGHGSIRDEVIGPVDRPATAAELERMKAMVAEGMRDGAFGLSTGLFYVPGRFAPTEEVVELARVAGASGGIHISHMRDEAGGVLASVRETIAIGELGGLPTQVTHHKIIGRPNWGRSAETLALIDAARARGVDATIDQYPYTASSTGIESALWPGWAQEGGRKAVLDRLRDPGTRARIAAETVTLLQNERGGGDPANVVIARCEWDPSLSGRDLGAIARARGFEATLEGAAQAVLWIVEQGGCQAVFHAISEDDLVRILRHPATMIASDGEVPVFGVASPHPRSYGTFARVLGVYVREKGVLSLEDAVRRMSSAPAQRVGLTDRGLLRAGMKADIVVFDPARVRDTATFTSPHQYAEGVSYVLVNGQIVLEDGAITAARPGRVLFGRSYVR